MTNKALTKRVPPEPEFDRDQARRAVEGILALSKGLTLDGLKIKDLINEGRP